MHVYLTGATGFIGSHVIPELLAAGHRVRGLVRSDEGARRLQAMGAEAHRGALEDPASVAAGVQGADAVIHTAFDHDMTNFAANCEKDRRVILALGEALKGSDRPFISTSGVLMGAPADGGPAREDVINLDLPIPRVKSEQAIEALRAQGVSTAVVRLPQVHDPVKQGLVPYVTAAARAKGRSAYVGDGANRWAAAHVDDVARLYRLALERHEPGARWHAVAEEGVPMRAIAEVIGEGLGVPVVSLTPEEAVEHFGWLAAFAGHDLVATSAWTRERLGWSPTGPDLLTDLRATDYAAAA